MGLSPHRPPPEYAPGTQGCNIEEIGGAGVQRLRGGGGYGCREEGRQGGSIKLRGASRAKGGATSGGGA